MLKRNKKAGYTLTCPYFYYKQKTAMRRSKRQRRVADCVLLSARAKGVYINVNDRAQDMQKGRKTRPYMLFGAEDGTRTRNVQLGKLTLYR